MKLVLIGLNHRTAPVEVRERYAIPPEKLGPLNQNLVRTLEVQEGILISTCNRTELLVVSSRTDEVPDRMYDFFQHEIGNGSAEPSHFYELYEATAVLHVLRVAASLDSMVLGEAQILGQLKNGYRAAVEVRSVGPILNRLFQRAFRAAKHVRSHTGLGGFTVSVARVGVNLACQLFESLADKKVLLMGAGEMAESALVGLRESGVREVSILSRTLETARRLATRLGGVPGTLEALPGELATTDVALSSLQIERPILGPADLAAVMKTRQGRPLLIVDLGIPRNVDPSLNELDNVYLYDLDDLERAAEQGRAERRSAIGPAEQVLAQERDHFEEWRASLPLVPTIRQLIRYSHDVARAELPRSLSQLNAPDADPEKVLERLAEGIVNKLLHRPLVNLRSESEADNGAYFADAIRQLFSLDEEEEAE